MEGKTSKERAAGEAPKKVIGLQQWASLLPSLNSNSPIQDKRAMTYVVFLSDNRGQMLTKREEEPPE